MTDLSDVPPDGCGPSGPPESAGPVDPASIDPFWTALRRADPAVDLVLLPPTDPPGGSSGRAAPGPAAPGLSSQMARALVEIADAEFAALLGVLGETAERIEIVPALWWGQGPARVRRYLLEAVASGFGPEGSPPDDPGEPRETPAAVAERLAADWRINGWAVIDLPAPRVVVEARLGPIQARVTTYPDRVRVSVRTSPVALDDEVARLSAVGAVGDTTGPATDGVPGGDAGRGARAPR